MPDLEYQNQTLLNIQLEGSDETTQLLAQNLIVRSLDDEIINNTVIFQADFIDLEAVGGEVATALNNFFDELREINGFKEAILEWGNNEKLSLKNAIEQGYQRVQGQSTGGKNSAKTKERELVIAYCKQLQPPPSIERKLKKQFHADVNEMLHKAGYKPVSAPTIRKWLNEENA